MLRRVTPRTACLAAALLLSSAALAATPSLPPGGRSLLPGDLGKNVIKAGKFADLATLTTVPVTGQSFGQAMRVTVNKPPNQPWDVQLKWHSAQPIKKGDVLLATFYARAAADTSEAGDATVNLAVQKAAPPWNGFLDQSLAVGRQWQRIDMPVVAPDDYPKDGSQFVLNLGFARQAVDVADFRVLDYGDKVKIESLPRTSLGYDGRAPDAAWRAEAAKRIDQYRKGQLTVKVVDAAGRPVPNATVSVDMTRLDFNLGTCIRSSLMDDTPDAQKLRDTLVANFNTVVFEGEMKWPEWEAVDKPGKDKATVQAKLLAISDWLQAHHIALRGHNLVWPASEENHFLPPDVYALIKAGDKEGLRKRIADHIQEEVTAWRGRVIEWDVLNEPWRHHVIQDLLGRDCMIDWFKEAHAADPSAKLYLNDFTMLSGGATDPERLTADYSNIQFLKDGGAPIDGIGEQAHFNGTLVGIPRMLTILDRFATFKLPIRMTEFDVGTGDAKLNGEYLRDFMTAAFSHPACNGVIQWGFWEGKHWKPAAALWRKDWSLSPAGQAYVDLLRAWSTHEKGPTDAAGTYATRAFCGDYAVTATAAGHTAHATATLGRDGQTVTVKLDR